MKYPQPNKEDKPVVIQLPESIEVEFANLEDEQLENWVKSLFEGQVGKSVKEVVIKGGKAIADNPELVPQGWVSVVWQKAVN